MNHLFKTALFLGGAILAGIPVYAEDADCAKPAEGAACCPAAKPSCCAEKAQDCAVLKQYIPLSEALATDDLAKAKAAAVELSKTADSEGIASIAKAAKLIADADGLVSARAAFKGVSAELLPMAQGATGYVVMTCPMAKADWLQTDDQVRNPYYGKSMLRCGMVKAEKSES